MCVSIPILGTLALNTLRPSLVVRLEACTGEHGVWPSGMMGLRRVAPLGGSVSGVSALEVDGKTIDDGRPGAHLVPPSETVVREGAPVELVRHVPHVAIDRLLPLVLKVDEPLVEEVGRPREPAAAAGRGEDRAPVLDRRRELDRFLLRLPSELERVLVDPLEQLFVPGDFGAQIGNGHLLLRQSVGAVDMVELVSGDAWACEAMRSRQDESAGPVLEGRYRGR